ncbi:MAG: ATP-dependent DNA helicase RecG [Flavobacteriales bacterium Tduv]
MSSQLLNTPIEYLKGVGKQRADWLRNELNVKTYEDLLLLYPHRYIDRSRFYKITEVNPVQAEIQLVGRITQMETLGQKKKKRLIAKLEDETGSVELIWFKKIETIKTLLKKDSPLVVFGRVKTFQNRIQIVHPDIEDLKNYRAKPKIPLHPVYPTTEKLQKTGLNNRIMVKLLQELVMQLKDRITENISHEILEKYRLQNRKEAFTQIHFPASLESLSKAQYRLKFEELFYLQLTLLIRKRKQKKIWNGYNFLNIGENFNQFYRYFLPFTLTNAQKRVLKEIRHDLGQSTQMNRLVQGDVGSGKTVIAIMSMLMALDNDFQSCLMAPTEGLATQHHYALRKLLGPMGISSTLLTGSTTQLARKQIRNGIETGKIPILIGTHALIEDPINFQNLGLAVIDEQHRFGVAQRAKLWKKNKKPPHVLIMTATPIPRTLAMTLYGDLDVSTIDELPAGRKPVKTVHCYEHARSEVFSFLKKEISQKRQIFIVYPLIEESEKINYKDLIDGYESINCSFPSPQYRISILHGRMKASEKEAEMNRFIKGETQIMVATTVIEVGVDVPKASVMLIESAERFGLSQLHQLRGRVGRGSAQSYCILITDEKLSEESRARVQIMCNTNDGFKIAEEDLRLRGPGDLMGTRQSGILELRIANLYKDTQIMNQARQAAIELLKKDPGLSEPKHQMIHKTFTKNYRKKITWSKIG